MIYTINGELYHHGIMGQKWGVRRYQNPDGTLTDEGRKRAQKKEFKVAQKSQRKTYRSSYDRMLDYQKKSKVVQEKSKELKSLSDKAKDLDLEMDNYRERDDIYNEAIKRSTELAKKDPSYGMYGEKVDNNLITHYLYDEDILKKTTNDMLKNDEQYKKLEKEYKDTIKAYKTKCKEITDDIIGEYGDKKISGLGTDMNYRELVYYALSKPNTMWMFTYEEDMGRK